MCEGVVPSCYEDRRVRHGATWRATTTCVVMLLGGLAAPSAHAASPDIAGQPATEIDAVPGGRYVGDGSTPQPVQKVFDSGQTVPLAPYLSYMVAGITQPGVLPNFSFPITTALRHGVLGSKFEGRKALNDKWLVQPIFIIGLDAHSLTWLRFFKDKLKELQAWGVVVQAPSVQSFKRLQQEADGIPLAPSQGAGFDEQLLRAGLNVYPILIGADGVVRQDLALTPELEKAGRSPESAEDAAAAPRVAAGKGAAR